MRQPQHGSPQVVVHLTNAPMQARSIDRRLMIFGVFVGLITVSAAITRVIVGGQSAASLIAAALVAAMVICLLFLYAWMRRRNATLYVREDRIGVTNWLGMRTEVPASAVDYLQIMSSAQKMAAPSRTLRIVAKDRRSPVQFIGSDRLEEGGIERVARLIGVPLR